MRKLLKKPVLIKKIFPIFVLLGLIFLNPFQLDAKEILNEKSSAQDIIDASLSFINIEQSLETVIELKVTKKSGKVKSKTLNIKNSSELKNNKKYQRTLVEFTAPKDIQGTKLLLRETDKDNSQFLYLPAFDKTKKIVGSQKNERFMGTDLTYSDFDKAFYDDSNLKRLADSTFSEQNVFVIEITNKESKKYDKVISYIDKVKLVPIKMEYFKHSKVIREISALKVEEKNNRFVVSEGEVKDIKRKSMTTWNIKESTEKNFELDSFLPDNLK